MSAVKVAAMLAGVLGFGYVMSARGKLTSVSPITIPDGDNWADFVQDGYVPLQYEPNLGNLDAFLAVIREGESSGNYLALVGGGEFTDTQDHPAITGEFEGIRRADGRLTTAAGAYQITRTTWLDIDGKGRFGSFNDTAQDAAAIFLLNRRGALHDVMEGRIELAVSKLKTEWEFFQKWTITRVLTAYDNAGGTWA